VCCYLLLPEAALIFARPFKGRASGYDLILGQLLKGVFNQ